MPQPVRAQDAQTAADLSAEAAASRYLEVSADEYLWKTDRGAEIVVRDLDISDYTVLNRFPDHLRAFVYDTIEKSDILRVNDASSDEDVVEADELKEKVKGNLLDSIDLSTEEAVKIAYELGTELVLLGWVRPEVVRDVDKDGNRIPVELGPGQIPLSRVRGVDRSNYLAHVFGGYQGEANALATFPEQQTADVGSRRAVAPVQPAPRRRTKARS